MSSSLQCFQVNLGLKGTGISYPRVGGGQLGEAESPIQMNIVLTPLTSISDRFMLPMIASH